VERAGGRAHILRNSDGLVYSVVGPAAELNHLADALLGALRAPAEDGTARLQAERALREERLAEWETAAGHVRAVLRSRLFPQDLPAAGTDASARRFSTAPLSALWSAVYDPERVQVVAVGDVDAAAVERAFGRLPAPPRARLGPPLRDTAAVGALAPPEATRGWSAIGYPLADASPAVVGVTVRLLEETVRQRLPSGAVEGEHWWTHHGQAVVVIASVPEADVAEGRRALGAALGALPGTLDARRVRTAATALRREMLFFSRTPDRMAEVVGAFADRTGDPDASQRYYDELADVDEASVRRLLTRLAAQTPVRVEVPPQPRRTP
jgi:predicted Zn-dependent peptidase